MVNLRNAKEYIENFLYISTKEATLKLLEFNAAQGRLYDVIKERAEKGLAIRIIILKARQLGFSTVAEAMLFHTAATVSNVHCAVIAHTEDSTANLFAMSRQYFEMLPDELKPMKKNSNAQELRFENPTKNPKEKKRNPGLLSWVRCFTAGGTGIGRSLTLHKVHVSEFAFWPKKKKEILLGIMQAVPNLPGTMVIIESTANGFDEFKTMWDDAVAGRSDFVPVFFPWFEQAEYRMLVEPGTQWTEEELALKEAFSLDGEQLQWRRWCIKNNCSGDLKLFRQEYPATPDEAFIMTGRAVFDNEIIMRRRHAVEGITPLRGIFEYDYDGLRISNIRFTERADGIVRIYKKPEDRHPYVLGGDTAGEGSDYFTGHVLDNNTGKQVAVIRHQMDEDLYAKQMYCLGFFYRWALIGIEANYTTYPIKELQRLNYPRQYVRETEDEYTHEVKESFGFWTDAKTRPVAIAELVQLMRETPELVDDYDTLGEMLTFVYNDRRRPEAAEGEHDDLVMGLAIAYRIRSQQRYLLEDEAPKTVKWTEDMWQDYYRASPDEKKYLIAKWGTPRR